jgi:CrcB protein
VGTRSDVLAEKHPDHPGSGGAGRSRGEPGRPVYLRPRPILLVVIGGALGTAARHGIADAVPATPGGWPLATLAVNLAGAFLLGVLLEALARRGPDDGWRRELRLFAGTGFCGGFTTYSAFAIELDLLLREMQPAVAAGYALASLVGGIVLTVLGIALAAGHHRWRRGRLPTDPDLVDGRP